MLPPFYNGTKIDNESAYIDSLDQIDNWMFKDNSTNKIISSMKLKSMWNKNFWKTIEHYMDKNLENDWNKVVDYTKTHIMKRSWKVQSKYKEILIEFVVVQLLRRDINMYNMGLDWLTNISSKTFTISSGESPQVFFGGKFKEALWLLQLYKYTQYKENPIKENENAITTCIDSINELYQPCFLIASQKAKFITSDNPCYVIKTSVVGLSSGIYLPITPNVCLFLCNCKGKAIKTKYYILDVCENNVKYINQLTKTNSFQEIAYFDNNVSNMFSKDIDLNNWRKMFDPLFQDIEL